MQLKKCNSDPGLQSTCLHGHRIKSYVSHNSFTVSSHKHHRLLMFYLLLSQRYYYFHLTKLPIEVHILSMQVFQLSEWYSWDLHLSAILHSVTSCLMPNSAAHVVTYKCWATNTWQYSAICQTICLICCLHETFTDNLEVSHQYVCNWWHMPNSHTKFVHFKLVCI